MTKSHRGGCLNCPATEDELSMETVLYYGFGGYKVMKGGDVHYQGDSNADFNSFKTLFDIENEARQKPYLDWKIILDNPLRGAEWTRKRGKWILTSTNQGFA